MIAFRPDGRTTRTRTSRDPNAADQNCGEKARGPSVSFEQGWFGSTNAGVLGGLLMILIAVVWFVLGLAINRIFIYPLILLVIGAIAVIKGLAGG